MKLMFKLFITYYVKAQSNQIHQSLNELYSYRM